MGFLSTHLSRVKMKVSLLLAASQAHYSYWNPPAAITVQSQTSLSRYSVLAFYNSILAMKHGEYIPELLAYMRDIIQVSKEFKWPVWIADSTWLRW